MYRYPQFDCAVGGPGNAFTLHRPPRRLRAAPRRHHALEPVRRLPPLGHVAINLAWIALMAGAALSRPGLLLGFLFSYAITYAGAALLWEARPITRRRVLLGLAAAVAAIIVFAWVFSHSVPEPLRAFLRSIF